MAFVKREYTKENAALYRSLVGEGVEVGMLGSWYVDETINAHLLNYGGRGDMPEELGMPPNTSLLVINQTIYHVEYRTKEQKEDGGYLCTFSLCRFSVKGEEIIPRPQVYKILEQAFFDYVQILNKQSIDYGYKFSVVLS